MPIFLNVTYLCLSKILPSQVYNLFIKSY